MPLAALEETRTALRTRAERAEADLDTVRAELRRLTEQLGQGADGIEQADNPEPRARPASRGEEGTGYASRRSARLDQTQARSHSHSDTLTPGLGPTH